MQSTWMLLLCAVLSINISYDWVTHIHLNENACSCMSQSIASVKSGSSATHNCVWFASTTCLAIMKHCLPVNISIWLLDILCFPFKARQEVH